MKQSINIIKYLLLIVIGIIIYYILNRKDGFSIGGLRFKWVYLNGVWTYELWSTREDAESFGLDPHQYQVVTDYRDPEAGYGDPTPEGAVTFNIGGEGTGIQHANTILQGEINEHNRENPSNQLNMPELANTIICSEYIDEFPARARIHHDHDHDIPEGTPGDRPEDRPIIVGIPTTCLNYLGYLELLEVDATSISQCLQRMHTCLLQPLPSLDREATECAAVPEAAAEDLLRNAPHMQSSDLYLQLATPHGEWESPLAIGGNFFRTLPRDIWDIIYSFILEIDVIQNLYVPIQTIMTRRILSVYNLVAFSPNLMLTYDYTPVGGGAPGFLELFRFNNLFRDQTISNRVTTIFYTFHLLVLNVFADIGVSFDIISSYLYVFFARFLRKFLQFRNVDPPIPRLAGNIENIRTLQDYFNLIFQIPFLINQETFSIGFEAYIIPFLIKFITDCWKSNSWVRRDIPIPRERKWWWGSGDWVEQGTPEAQAFLEETNFAELMGSLDPFRDIRGHMMSQKTHMSGVNIFTIHIPINYFDPDREVRRGGAGWHGGSISITSLYRIIILLKRLGCSLDDESDMRSLKRLSLVADNLWTNIDSDSVQTHLQYIVEHLSIPITVNELREHLTKVVSLFSDDNNLSEIIPILMEFIQIQLIKYN